MREVKRVEVYDGISCGGVPMVKVCLSLEGEIAGFGKTTEEATQNALFLRDLAKATIMELCHVHN